MPVKYFFCAMDGCCVDNLSIFAAAITNLGRCPISISYSYAIQVSKNVQLRLDVGS